MDGDRRYTRDDLIQVEFELNSLMLEDQRRKRRENASVVAADFLGVEDPTRLVQGQRRRAGP